MVNLGLSKKVVDFYELGSGIIYPRRLSSSCTCILSIAREDEEVREVIPHIGPLPIVIPLKLFLDFLRDTVLPRGLTDSQSYVPIFAMSTAERFSTQ